MSEDINKNWLLADIDGDDVEFALAEPGPEPVLKERRHYKASESATAIDAFQKYARDTGVSLENTDCGLVVSGAVLGDSIRIARSPWIVSRSGLAHILGKKPITVNDSAVKSWANIGHSPHTHKSLSAPATPDFRKTGRWVTINVAGGLGASALIRPEDGRPVLVDTEIGHVGFAPHDKQEAALADVLQGYRGGTSWEMALFAHKDSMIWGKAGLPDDPREIARLRAGMLGSFAGDAVLAMGGWDGLFLHGAKEILPNADAIAIFNQRFEQKTAYKIQIRRTPRWSVDMEDASLKGAAYMLWQKLGNLDE